MPDTPQPYLPSAVVQRRGLLQFGLVYVLVWLATWYSASVLATMGVASLWYLPAGLRFFCLFALGTQGLALEIAAGLVLMLLQLAFAAPAQEASLSLQLLDHLFNLLVFPLAYALAVLPLRRQLRGMLDFTLPLHTGLFVASALVAAAFAASAGTARLVLLGQVSSTQWPEVLLSWTTGDFIGTLTLAPCLLVLLWPRLRHYLQHGHWASSGKRRAPASYRYEVLLVAGLTALALWGVGVLPHYFGRNHQSPLLALLLLLPLATVALRYRLRGAVLAVVLLDSGLVLIVALLGQQALALPYQLVMVAIALVGLWLGGTVEASHRLLVRLEDFSTVSNDLLWETNRYGVLQVSGRLSDALAFTPGQSWRSLLAPVPQPQLALMEQASTLQQPFSHLEIALRHTGTAPRWVSVNGLPLWDAQGDFAGYRGTAADISDAVQVKALVDSYNLELLNKVSERTAELHRSNTELAIKEQHLRVLLAAAPVGVLELGEDGCCRYLNPNGLLMTGRSMEDSRGLHLLDFVHAEDRERVQQVLQQPGPLGAVVSQEFRLDISNIWCTATWIQTRLEPAAAATTVVVLVDSTLQHQQSERLWAMAHTDLLTGLPNRNLFQDRCHQALTLAKRHDSGAALLWIDLDGFKAVNDTLGHAAGDALLQQVALRLKNRMRDIDTVARIGGDEFAVVMTDVDQPEAAEQIAEVLVASLRNTFDLPQGATQISASIGIALYPQHAESVETLMGYADTAMYVAKRGGKDRIQIWNEGLTVSAAAPLTS